MVISLKSELKCMLKFYLANISTPSTFIKRGPWLPCDLINIVGANSSMCKVMDDLHEPCKWFYHDVLEDFNSYAFKLRSKSHEGFQNILV